MFERILVAIDGSPTSDRGLKAAIELAADQHAKLTIINVLDDMSVAVSVDGGLLTAEFYDRVLAVRRDQGYTLVARAEKAARERGVAVEARFVETIGQSAAQTILAEAQTARADLIVLGTHGRRGVRRLLLGSDAEAVLRESQVPVMLVRDPDGDRRAGEQATKTVRTGA